MWSRSPAVGCCTRSSSLEGSKHILVPDAAHSQSLLLCSDAVVLVLSASLEQSPLSLLSLSSRTKLSQTIVPELDDACYIHFRGTLPDGTEFINSDRRTIAEKGFTVNKTDVAEQVKRLHALKRQRVELEQYEKAREIKDQINALGRMVSTGSPAKPMKFVPNKVFLVRAPPCIRST